MIGVKLGDGYTTKKRRTIRSYISVRIGLKVKDMEFAEEFARCLAKVLGRQFIKPRLRYSDKKYAVEVRSKTLYELLKKPVNLDGLKKYIEHCEDCVAAFLRGFFDSEGCVNERGYISISNTDIGLLTYVKDLLGCLGIASTEPKLGHPQGRAFFDPREGKIYTTNKDCYCLHIRANSNTTFYRKVGFTIKRKQKRLENYIKRCQAKPPSPPSPPYTILNPSICIALRRGRDLNPGPAGVPAVCSGPRRPTWLDYGRWRFN